MKDKGKILGVIVSVEGTESDVAMYSMSNDTHFIWYGDILIGPRVGALLTIHQNDVKIIASVFSEKVIDNKNTVQSEEFDNRFSKDSINRIIKLKTKGIIENDKFQVTSKYVPMIGNEVSITTQEDLDIVYGLKSETPTIEIGNSMLEGKPIKLSINKFFASHIGIFGNTGSGKSNTLHKLYLELFRTNYLPQIKKKSQFFVIDFNGEYTSDGIFGIKQEDRKVFDINTRKDNSMKLPISIDYLLDADILSILFDARPATQVPFLRNAIKTYKKKIKNGEDFATIEIGLFVKIIESFKITGYEAVNNWILACENIGIHNDQLVTIKNFSNINKWGNTILKIPDTINDEGVILKDGKLNEAGEKYFRIDILKQELKKIYDKSNPIIQLKSFLEFQKVYVSSWKSTNIEYINPLFKRIESAFNSLEKVVEVKEKDEVYNDYKFFNIISLVNANSEITRLIPMLLSKMIYDNHKEKNNSDSIISTTHLIIDEAHNILNDEYKNTGDDWQDYRLSVFEEIIKEGRKFGFYITLASQRPADISETITSQVHNFFVHRLVNDKDLRMLENTMPTLDKSSYQMIPSLGQGEAVITGNALSIPIFTKVHKEESIHPNSDDIVLTDLWSDKDKSIVNYEEKEVKSTSQK